MKFIQGRDSILAVVRFQMIAHSDFHEQDYWIKFYKKLNCTWTVIYRPEGARWAIYLSIMLTHDEIDVADPFFEEVRQNHFPPNAQVKRICIFQVDENFFTIDKN